MRIVTHKCDLCGSEVNEAQLSEITIHYDGDSGQPITKSDCCDACVAKLKQRLPISGKPMQYLPTVFPRQIGPLIGGGEWPDWALPPKPRMKGSLDVEA